MKSFVFANLIVLGLTSMRAADEGAQSLRGEWVCVSATVDGRALGEKTVAALRLTLTGNRYKSEKKSEVLFDSTYTTDDSKVPKQINMIGTEGDLAGKEARGIYRLENELLTICYTMPDKPRPTTFESKEGSGNYLAVWKRVERR